MMTTSLTKVGLLGWKCWAWVWISNVCIVDPILSRNVWLDNLHWTSKWFDWACLDLNRKPMDQFICSFSFNIFATILSSFGCNYAMFIGCVVKNCVTICLLMSTVNFYLFIEFICIGCHLRKFGKNNGRGGPNGCLGVSPRLAWTWVDNSWTGNLNC